MNPIATWFYNLFKPAPLKAAEAYMERLEASIDPSRLSLTEFNRVVDEIEKDPLNPLRQLEIQSLEKYQPEHFFKEWRKTRQELSHLQEDHEQEKKLYKEQFNNNVKRMSNRFFKFKSWRKARQELSQLQINHERRTKEPKEKHNHSIKRIVACSQFELNQFLRIRGISHLDEKTALKFQPWLDLNKKIKEKRAFIYSLDQLGAKIAHATSLVELNKLLPAGIDLLKNLAPAEKKIYNNVIFQWCVRRRQGLQHEYIEKIKGQYENQQYTETIMVDGKETNVLRPLLLISIPSAELMQLMDENLIDKKDIFNIETLAPEKLHAQLMILIANPNLNIEQQKNVRLVAETYFSSTALTQLILNSLQLSSEPIIKNLCTHLQQGITGFITSMLREPNFDEMKTLILNAVGKAITDETCTQKDIAVLFNALKPTHAPLSNPALHAAQHFLRDTIHTKTKYGAFYSCKVTTGTWDRILILLKNKAAILKVQASVKTIAQTEPALTTDPQIQPTTQQTEPTTDEESINDHLIDIQRYQIFRSTKLDADEHATVAESAATHTKAPTGWFQTETRKKLAASGDDGEKVAYFEAQMQSVCAP